MAFVADGAVLPRASGVDPAPLSGERVVPFAAPETLRVTLNTPHAGPVTGAAAVAEAIEAGASALLIDEDTSATNFLVRDARMQRLVRGCEEPITVLLDRVRDLHDQLGISTILAMGGSGDYFDAADHVIQLLDYQPRDVTSRARAVAAELPSARCTEIRGALARPSGRTLLAGGLDPINEHGHHSIRALAARRIAFGRAQIDPPTAGAIVLPCGWGQHPSAGPTW